MATETLTVTAAERRTLPSGTEKMRVRMSNGGWYDVWEPHFWPLMHEGEVLDVTLGVDKAGAAKITYAVPAGVHSTVTEPSKSERKWLRVVALQSAVKTITADGPMARYADDGEVDPRVARIIIATAATYLTWLREPD